MNHPDIGAKQQELIERRIKVWPQRNLRASSIGHPCDWFLWSCIARGQEIEAFPWRMHAIFEEGKRQEQHGMNDLIAMGYQIQQGQRALWDQGLKLSAHMEWILVDRSGEGWLSEFKSMSPYSYQAINSVQDMLASDYHYMRGYPWQMEAYRMMAEDAGIMKPGRPGLWIFKDKSSGMLKSCVQEPDQDLRDRLRAKCIRINEHIADNTEPAKLCDPSTCDDCRMRAACGPDLMRSGMQVFDDGELEKKLGRRQELSEAHSEYQKLDRSVKKSLAGVERGIVGLRWHVTGKEITRKGYTVDSSNYWQLKIKEV